MPQGMSLPMIAPFAQPTPARRPVLGGRLWVVLVALLPMMASFADAQPAPPPADNPEELVRRLGSDEFEAREEAQQALARLGDAAIPALRAGAEQFDREIRHRSRYTLALIKHEQFNQLLSHFLKGAGQAGDFGLPGWSRAREQLGDTLATRQLFVSALRAEAELLRLATEQSSPKALNDYIVNRIQMLQQLNQQQQQIELGSILAMLVVASDPTIEINDSAYAMVTSLCHQQSFREAFLGGASREHLHKLLGKLILRSSDMYLSQGLSLAQNYDMGQEGLVLVERALRHSQYTHHRHMAMQALLKFGDIRHLPWVEPLLEVRDQMGSRNEGEKVIPIQVRDMALRVCIQLADKQPSDFGMPGTVQERGQFNWQELGFAEEAKRTEAIQRWREFSKGLRSQWQPPLEEF